MATDKSGKRLGRGLDALLGGSSAANINTPIKKSEVAQSSVNIPQNKSREDETGLRNIRIAQIRPNPFQPRSEFRQDELRELQESIKASGLLQPITIRKASNGVGFELIAGERRLRAATNLGWTEIPAIVKDVDDKSALTLALIENLQRSDLNPIEEGEGYLRLQDEFGLSQPQIAELVGKDRSTIANLMRVLSLPAAVKQMLENRSLTHGHARPLLTLQDRLSASTNTAGNIEEAVIKLANEITTEGLSVRTVENKVRQTVATSATSAAPRRGRPMKSPSDASGASAPILNNTIPVKSAQVMYIENQVRKHLQTDIAIKLTGTEKGELIIQFYSTDDLERILEQMGIELYTDV